MRPRNIFLVAMLALSLLVCVYASYNIAGEIMNRVSAAREYDSLRLYFPEVLTSEAITEQPDRAIPIPTDKPDRAIPIPTDKPDRATPAPTEKPVRVSEELIPLQPVPPTPTPDNTFVQPAAERIAAPSSALSGINPDYIGWIRIKGTVIDYPVVRGIDNNVYLDKTFRGSYNPAGAVFMDYRCDEGFGDSLVVIYGHNMNDGSMFSQLEKYLDSAFFNENPIITVIDPNGTELNYTVSEARITDINDGVYMLPFNEPEEGNAENVDTLVLSTCTNTGNDDERLLVLAKKTLQ